MFKKNTALLLILILVVGVFNGCAIKDKITETTSGSDSISNIPPISINEVAGRRLLASTNEERTAQMYKYVTDRIIVDKSRLIEVDSSDRQNIAKLFNSVNEFLTGNQNEAMNENFANYLLLEFANTPYEWQQNNIDIVGFDPAARLYFVDVTYQTTGITKRVVPNSKIPNGAPKEERLKSKRYTDYVMYLTAKQQMDPTAETYKQTFVNRWGSIESIMNEQQGISLLERTFKNNQSTGGIGKLTYSGLVSDSHLAKTAKMTVRYVLKYRLNLGEETDLMVNSLYLKDYEVDNYKDLIAQYDKRTVGTIEVLKPFIDQLILSYQKAVEESNFTGLYQMFEDFGSIDKYYQELRDYTYKSIGGYTYEVLQRNGSTVTVKIDRVNKIRARGANMSLPTYDETLILNLVLGNDDTIRIRNVIPVKRTLIGEPLSVIKNVSGISDIIRYEDASFTDTNKEKIKELIKDFSKVVTNGDVSSDEFLRTVDLGVSQTTLNRIADTITAVKANKKALYITNWDTQTNVFASISVREVFALDKNNLDTEAVIDVVNRNGEWKVVNYTRQLNIKTKKTDLDSKNALTIDERTSKGENTEIYEKENTDPVEITPNENVESNETINIENESQNEPTEENILEETSEEEITE